MKKRMATFSSYEASPVNVRLVCSLDEVFKKEGLKHGYGEVKARFHPFKEFKAQWQRCGDKIDFLVTDYMEPASPELITDFAGCLLKRVGKRQKSEMYTERMKGWMLSDEFVAKNRPLYLRRSRNITCKPTGRVHDLHEGLERLKAAGLVQPTRDPFMTWTKRPNLQRLGYTSVLMNVVAISSAMDDDRVPEYVSDYVLYHEMVHISDGLRSSGSYHDSEFHRRERMFPQWREAEVWLKRLASGR